MAHENPDLVTSKRDTTTKARPGRDVLAPQQQGSANTHSTWVQRPPLQTSSSSPPPSTSSLACYSHLHDLTAPRTGLPQPLLRNSSSPVPSTSANVPGLTTRHSHNLLHFSATSLSPTTSLAASPHNSRNTSPVRRDSRPSSLAACIATQPSAAAIQRALSAASAPQLSASSQVSDAFSRLPRTHKSAASTPGERSPHWPVSPRLKSPPPTFSARRSFAMAAQPSRPASINIEPATPPTNASTEPPPPSTTDDPAWIHESQQLQPPTSKSVTRAPSGKSTLETVQENSADSQEPSPAALQAAADLKPSLTRPDDATTTVRRAVPDLDRLAESGSESAGNRSDNARGRRPSLSSQGGSVVSKAKSTAGKPGYGTLTSAKARQAEGKQGMTVETETVPSIPQSALNPGDRRADAGGSVRLKASNETIRPKKDRKKASQKARNVTQGTASSKADIFEARVASAVDAHSSDSDDTFVYESNPPEAQRPRRHHSRTPSVTSSHSIAEQQSTIRPFMPMPMDDRKVAGKRSMKFSNHNDLDHPDSKPGTVRSHRPRRLRTDRDGSHPSMLEHDSPFTQASKLRNATSRPNSPRSSQSLQTHRPSSLTKKSEQSFDFDGGAADDERTPLITSGTRSARGGRTRRLHSGGPPSLDSYYHEQGQDKRWAGLVKGLCLGLVVLVGAIFFAVAILVLWNRPMYDVKIKQIENVLATEQEIILDLCVGAVNPNMLSINIPDMDLNVFAKSKHVGKSTGYLTVPEAKDDQNNSVARRGRRPHASTQPAKEQDVSALWRKLGGGVDHGTDPPGKGDLEKDSQTMLLGRVFKFDQALNFENALFTRKKTYALGELSLMKPGNKTETGGSARWERVLQYPFELIVRGTLRYRLPISMKVQSVAVEGSVIVHPEEGTDSTGNMRLEPVPRSRDWEWIEWPEEDEEVSLGSLIEYASSPASS